MVKAIGNGYGITAIIGKRDIMQAAQATFISVPSGLGIGPTAALENLGSHGARQVMGTDYTDRAECIAAKWRNLAEKYGLSISTSGLPALTTFSFNSHNALAYKTLITQEMLKNESCWYRYYNTRVQNILPK